MRAGRRIAVTHARAGSRRGVHPNTQQPATIAGAAALIAAVMALALVIRAASDGISFASFLAYLCALVLTGVATLCGYWAISLNSLRYELIGGALMINWGLSRQVVPLANMQRVVRGRSLGLPVVDGLSFPGWGCHIGRARVPRVGKVLFYSTHRAPEEILYLVTAETAYGLSPVDQPGFIQALQAAMGQYAGLEGVRQELQRHPLAALPFWSDRVALAAAAPSAYLRLLPRPSSLPATPAPLTSRSCTFRRMSPSAKSAHCWAYVPRRSLCSLSTCSAHSPCTGCFDRWLTSSSSAASSSRGC